MQIIIPKTNVYYLLRKNKDINSLKKINILNIDYYFIIQHLDNCKLKISYNHNLFVKNKLTKNNFVPIIFIANNAKGICNLINYHKTIYSTISSDHALYLGRELMKAEFALVMGQQYIQD